MLKVYFAFNWPVLHHLFLHCRRLLHHIITTARLYRRATQSTEDKSSEAVSKRLREECVEDGVDAAVRELQAVANDHNQMHAWRVKIGTLLRQHHHLTYTASSLGIT